MKVLISGASGLIGSALSARLQIDRNEVVRLVRYPPQGEGEVFWNPMSGSIDAIGMEGMDAVVHLAGENIAGGRWTEKRKQRFRESRVGGTQLLCSALAQLAVPPRVLVCASAIGYYGHCGDRLLNEEDGAGEGFLAGLVRDWEGATEVLAEKRIRVVLARRGAQRGGRGAGQVAAAVSTGARREDRRRPSVYELDCAGGCGRGNLPRAGVRRNGGADERGGAGAGDQRRIHARSGQGAEKADADAAPGRDGAIDAGGDGRRTAVGQHPGCANAVDGDGVRIPLPGVGGGAATFVGRIAERPLANIPAAAKLNSFLPCPSNPDSAGFFTWRKGEKCGGHIRRRSRWMSEE